MAGTQYILAVSGMWTLGGFGASLVGLRGIVVKSHGGADRVAFRRAIEVALAEVTKKVPDRIIARIEPQLGRREAV